MFLRESSRQSEVGELDMSTAIKKNVVGLDITMYEPEFVYSLNGQSDLGHVESGDVFGEDLVLDQHGHQVSSRQELHQHVQERLVLE